MRRSLCFTAWLTVLGAGVLSVIMKPPVLWAQNERADIERQIANSTWQPRYTVNVLTPCEPLEREELERIIAMARIDKKANLCSANLRWKTLERRSWQRVNLTGAQLTGANLAHADLRGARLVNAALGGANLTGANLAGADLQGAAFYHPHPGRATFEDTILAGADLRGANLQDFDLRNLELGGALLAQSWLARADLRNADLAGAQLRDAVLYGARLDGADLSGSNLADADLRAASMVGATIDGASFEPKALDGQTVLGVNGLSEVTFDDPSKMVELKQALRAIGLRREERAVISALRKYQLRTAPALERWFDRYVLGGALTDFGAEPSRPIAVLLLGVVGFAFAYVWAFRFPSANTGVWKVWPEGRLAAGRLETVAPEPVCGGSLYAAGKLALQFSLLSAFRIGWREFNVGSWLARIQPHEYVFRATGWMRTVSGIQSVLSVYLLALWALSYFGRPFE